MEMTVREHTGEKVVTILSIDGMLDGTNFTELIDKAKQLFGAGTENLVLDMEKCEFMSSAGIWAIYSISLIARGEEPPNPEHGWAAFRSMGKDINEGLDINFKMSNLKAKVKQSLEITGMLEYLDVFDNLESALASF